MKIELKLRQRVGALLIGGACLSGSVMAQQDAQFTQFFSNQLSVNPAYAGSRDALSVIAIHRNQWTGFPGAPMTETVTVHAPIMKGKSGLGGSLMQDNIGISSHTVLSGAYAYRMDLGSARLSLGLSGEMRLQRVNWLAAHPLDGGDPQLGTGPQSLLLPNFGTGVYLEGKQYFLGAAVPHLLEPALKSSSTNPAAGHLSQLRRHFFATGGLALQVHEGIVLRPQVLVKFVAHAPVELDLNLGVILKDKLWVGCTYRYGDSMDYILQYSFSPRVKLGYSYDQTLTALHNYSHGSHEIMLALDLGKSRSGFFHPRYF